MPRIETTQTTVYKFSELSDQAKQHAIEKQSQYESSEGFDAECVIDDAVNMAALIGIEIDTHAVKLMNNTTRQDPAVYYSGFCSQGDGASFEGRYAYRKGAPAAIKAETASKGDRELLRIATTLQEVQRRNFYQLTSRMGRGHNSNLYSHSGTMSVDVERYDEKPMTDDAEDTVKECMRDFADWIYSQLENEYDYRTGEEACQEAIEINDYDFTEDGEMY